MVSKILRTWNFEVFDCDSEAKALMDADNEIKRRLQEEIAFEIVNDGVIDRKLLSAIVFADNEKLLILNSIVHAAVKRAINKRASNTLSPVFFIETAILYASGLNEMVDGEWRVTAPEELRIERVMKRNGFSRQQVEARMAAQESEISGKAPNPPLTEIINDISTPLLPQLVAALNSL